MVLVDGYSVVQGHAFLQCDDGALRTHGCRDRVVYWQIIRCVDHDVVRASRAIPCVLWRDHHLVE